jgi:uncharacterized membrane protein HdeD (DUF308 family)
LSEDLAMTPATSLRTALHHSWGWLLALGLVLMLFGGLILTTPLGVITATLSTEIWIAAALIVVGILQLAHGLRATTWSGRIWQMLGGVIFIVGGILMFIYPTVGLVSVTLIVAATLIAQGITSLMVSSSVGEWSRRKWLILSAAISIVAGILVLFDLPTSADWTLGVIVGAVLLLQGISLTLLAFEVMHAEPATA